MPINALRLTLPVALLLLAAGCASPPAHRVGREAAPAYRHHAPLSSEQAGDIAIHALGLVGTPYRHGGNTPDGGFDCSGLIGYVYHSRAGLAPPRTVAQLGAFGEPVPAGDLRTGDLVLFGAAQPTHAGIYVGGGRFVHAPSNGGAVRLDRLASSYWSRQALAVRRP